MPRYQYKCADCDHDFEVVQKFSDASLTDCPECDGNLRKVFSAVGVVFKGSGFYATDNRTKGKANAATRSASSGSSSTESSGSTDSAQPASPAASPSAASSSTPAASTPAA